MSPRFLVVEEAAELLRESPRTVQARAAKGAIPHRRVGGTRRLLFVEAELVAYLNGCELEVLETPNGGRVVRPKAGAR